jgi:hypothetical protein
VVVLCAAFVWSSGAFPIRPLLEAFNSARLAHPAIALADCHSHTFRVVRHAEVFAFLSQRRAEGVSRRNGDLQWSAWALRAIRPIPVVKIALAIAILHRIFAKCGVLATFSPSCQWLSACWVLAVLFRRPRLASGAFVVISASYCLSMFGIARCASARAKPCRLGYEWRLAVEALNAHVCNVQLPSSERGYPLAIICAGLRW